MAFLLLCGVSHGICTDLFDKFVGEFVVVVFRLTWVFVAAHGLSLVAATVIYSLVVVCGLLVVGLLLLQSTDSRVWAQ